jgi:hypothetical protein
VYCLVLFCVNKLCRVARPPSNCHVSALFCACNDRSMAHPTLDDVSQVALRQQQGVVIDHRVPYLHVRLQQGNASVSVFSCYVVASQSANTDTWPLTTYAHFLAKGYLIGWCMVLTRCASASCSGRLFQNCSRVGLFETENMQLEPARKPK